MKKKDPLRWMPWDVVSWMLSRRVAALSPLARGAYFELLCRQWYDGALPSDDASLCICARVSPDQWAEAKTSVLQFFEEDENGGLRQSRCEQEKQEAIGRLKRFEKRAKKAANYRWQKQRDNNDLMLDGCNKHTRSRNKTKTIPIPSVSPFSDAPKPDAPTGAFPPPGHTTVFDDQAELEKLTRSYDPLGPEKNLVLESVRLCTESLRPAARLTLLRDLSQFPPGQVSFGSKRFLENGKDKGRQYYLAVVKGVGKEWAHLEDERERKAERKAQNQRIVEAAKAKSLRDGKESIRQAGDIAKTLLGDLGNQPNGDP